MAKYRVNGKFVKFKDFVKSNGLDSVNYSSLTSHEKKVWNGINSYENRITLKGQFATKSFLKNKSIRKALEENAERKGMKFMEYLKKYNKEITDFFEVGAFFDQYGEREAEKLVINHSGKFFYNGKEITRNEMNWILSEAKLKAKMENSAFTTFDFELKAGGHDLHFKQYHINKSGKYKKANEKGNLSRVRTKTIKRIKFNGK